MQEPQTAPPDKTSPLTRGQLLAYCIYAVPLIATTAAIGNFIPPYFSQEFGMSLTLVASSLMLIRAIDAICDPLIGVAIDRSGFRQKHRPWLLIALPLYLVAVALLFMPVESLVSPVYLVVVGAAVYIAFTIGMIVHQAWAAALTDDPVTLSRLFGYREVGVIAGVLGVFALAAVASYLYGSDIGAQARAAGLFILVSITICTIITYIFTPDREAAGVKAHGKADWSILRPFLLSRDFVLLSLAILIYNSGWTSMGAMAFFVAQDLYHAPQYFALGLTLTFLVAPFGMAFWMKLAARLGDKRTLFIACLYLGVVVLFLPLATRMGAVGLFTIQTLLGLGFGAGPYLLRSITGILANAYIARTGCEVRGAAFAMTNFFDKLGSGLGASALLPLAYLGFDPKAGMDDTARSALLIVATVTPVVGFFITAVLVRALKAEGASAHG